VLQRVARVLTAWSTRWVPDAYVIAALLTGFTFVLALVFTDSGPFALVRYWGSGFWELLSFAMQMCLIIMTGYILAVSRPMQALFARVAGLARSPRGAVMLTALLSMALAWFHWGLSIVGSAVFVRYVARRQPRADYRLLVCAAYLGLGTLWHAGLSASMPLLVATPGHFMQQELGIVPVSRTLFHPFNLLLVAGTVGLMTALARALQSPGGDEPRVDWDAADDAGAGFESAADAATTAGRPPAAAATAAGPPPDAASASPARRLENSLVVGLVIGGAGLIWLGWWFGTHGLAGINLNTVNFAFLMLGILLHGRPAALLAAAERGGHYVWGVILQFPFYAGIFGIIKESKLQDVIAGWFTALSTPKTYPLIVLWYSGCLNYIVPSGGSKWAIEAPYIVKAGHDIGANMNFTVLAYAWGDMLTDIIQPFWAIPLLAIARLSFRDIMGYGLIFFLAYAVLVTLGFALVPLLS
jgi:short-chain fatty acids transporter